MDKSLYHSDQPIMAVQILHLLIDVYSGITRYPVIPLYTRMILRERTSERREFHVRFSMVPHRTVFACI